MKEQGQYKGARWVRTDLHLHSPGAYGFTCPPDPGPQDRDAVVQRYVEQLEAQGIEVAAITDYQQVRKEWFVPIREAARERGIYVYPGVELSFGGSAGGKRGLHLLAVFPYDADIQLMNRAVDKILDGESAERLLNPDGSHRDLKPQGSLTACLPRFQKETGALLIVAHPNGSKGLLTSYSPGEAAQLLQTIPFDAVESLTERDRRRLLDTGEIDQARSDTLASIEGSDNHNIPEIGAKTRPNGLLRTTYLKLSVRDDLRAIRLALRDSKILVRVGEKPDYRYTHLERLEVDGDGFLGGLSLDFSSELNTLVGGRGVGKSAILETIRYILDLPLYSPTEYRDALVGYALGSGGKAVLHMVQYLNAGTVRRYRFERGWKETPRVFELEPGREQEVLLSPLDVLGEREAPLYFGQKEIFDITESLERRRLLLDEMIGKQAGAQVNEVRKLGARLRENARLLLDYRRKSLERADVEQALREVGHKIRVYRQHGLAQKLAQATALAADEERLSRAMDELEAAQEQWDDFDREWEARWSPLTGTLREGQSDLQNLLQQAAERLDAVRTETEKLLARGRTLLESAKRDLETIQGQWRQARRPLDDDIRRVKQELGAQSLDPDELVRLTASETNLQAQLEILAKIEDKMQQVQDERHRLLRDIREARRRVWKLRSDRAHEITEKLAGRVRIEVVYRGDTKAYQETLRAFFRGSGADGRTIEKIAAGAVDGIELAKKVRAGAEAVAEAYDLSEKRAQQIINYLADESKLYELELLSPPDHVRVFLDGQPIAHLSAGQRATAMLLILLAQDDRVMIVDQPEDDLDNRFIYQDIVRLLREQKGKRQFLAATHNPNIPVLAHAEMIIALESQDDRCQISLQGGMDNRTIQDFVRNVMEGGEEAFRRRARKYGLD